MKTPAALLGLTLAAGMIAGTALAQDPTKALARLTDVKGEVLISSANGMVSAVNNQLLLPGTRVVTVQGASVKIHYEGSGGCQITLTENERFTVRAGSDCAALAKEVTALSGASAAIGGTAGAGGAAGGGAAGYGTFAGAALGAGAAYGVYEGSKKKTSNSPN